MVWLGPQRSKGQRSLGRWLYERAISNYTRRMKNFSFGLSLLLSLGSWMVGCGDSESGSPCASGELSCDGFCIDAIVPTLSGPQGIQAGVFQGSCAAFTNCHGGEGIAGAGLELSSVSVSAQNLIDVESTQVPTELRVASGNSADSYLMNKLLGVDMEPGTLRMPIGGVLCDAKLEAVRQWIDAGAPVN